MPSDQYTCHVSYIVLINLVARFATGMMRFGAKLRIYGASPEALFPKNSKTPGEPLIEYRSWSTSRIEVSGYCNMVNPWLLSDRIAASGDWNTAVRCARKVLFIAGASNFYVPKE